MFDAEKVKNELVGWIRQQMVYNGGKKVVIGISGGKDSSVVAALCVAALGQDNVIGVLMPDGEQADIQYSYDLVNHLGIKHYLVNIEETVKAETRAIEGVMGCKLSVQARINLPPRIRMSTLFAVAQTVDGGRVTCNGNLSEIYLGYVTFGGDTVASLAPLANLTTDEVVELGRELGLPSHLIDKEPADGLTTKSDEDRFGFTYEVLNKYIRTGVCEDAIIREKIDRMHESSRFKFLPIPMFNPNHN